MSAPQAGTMKGSTAMAAVITEIMTANGMTPGEHGHVKVLSPGFMPLSVEVIGTNVVSVTHYGEQNGDLMADPDMVFYVQPGGWAPLSYRNDYVGAFLEAAEVVRDRLQVTNVSEYVNQVDFADSWAQAIRAQGFVEHSA